MTHLEKPTWHPSPNFDQRDCAIDMIILHYTGMKSGAAALKRLCDSEAKVSAHYLVEEDGTAFQMVEESQRAWHAGRASWRDETNINARSIGIEIVNPGHEFGYRDFPTVQIDRVIDLMENIRQRHSIKLTHILGHCDVAPRRKEDPGELFPWASLAAAGVAIGPYVDDGAEHAITYGDALSALQAIGYDAPDGDHTSGLLAFQRRFCPASLGRGFDPLTKAALLSVVREFAG